jgi:hypothetical protein
MIACMRLYVYIGIHKWNFFVNVPLIFAYVYTYTIAYIYKHTYTYIYKRIHTGVDDNVYGFSSIWIPTYVHINILAYAHTNTHTCRHFLVSTINIRGKIVWACEDAQLHR